MLHPCRHFTWCTVHRSPIGSVTVYRLDGLLSQSAILCPVLTVFFLSAYRFPRRQVRWSSTSITLRIFQFVVIHKVKSFSVVNEVDGISWNFIYFSMSQWMLAMWPLVPLNFLNSTCASGSSQFMYCWSLAWRVLSVTLLKVKWAQIYGTLKTYLAFFWDCNENGLVLLKEIVCNDKCVFLINSVNHFPASFCTPRLNLPVIPSISWLPSFAFQSPMKKRTSFWC